MHSLGGDIDRIEPRFAVKLFAEVRTEAAEMPARLLDLSRGGALAEARQPPAPGTRCTLARERLEVGATVRWVRGGRFGLLFDERLRATDLFFQLGRSRSAGGEACPDPGRAAACPRPRSAMA